MIEPATPPGSNEAYVPFADGTPEPSYALRYLFEVEFSNGAKYHQTPEDISAFDPSRTPWWDITQEKIQPLSEVRALRLRTNDPGESGSNVSEVEVDLASGYIFINGAAVWAAQGLSYIPAGAALQPYYARAVRRRWDATISLGSGQFVDKRFGGIYVHYVVGWDTIIDGTAYQARIAIP